MLLGDKKVYVVPVFSMNMLFKEPQEVSINPLRINQALELARQAQSAIRSPWMAAIMSDQLGIQIPTGEDSVKLDDNTRLLVGWYSGPQLGPGCTQLPPNGRITWWLISRR